MKSKAMAPKTRNSRVMVSLSRADLEWIAGIAACVVRFNQLAKPPDDWREIPAWWKQAKAELPPSDRHPSKQVRHDLGRAIAVLASLSDAQKQDSPKQQLRRYFRK